MSILDVLNVQANLCIFPCCRAVLVRRVWMSWADGVLSVWSWGKQVRRTVTVLTRLTLASARASSPPTTST